MEEKKLQTENVSMDNKQQPDNQLSYEDMSKMVVYLRQRNEQLLNALREMDMTNMFKRLDYLFKVLEVCYKYPAPSYYPCFDKEFVGKCIMEIQEAMTLKQEEERREE